MSRAGALTAADGRVCKLASVIVGTDSGADSSSWSGGGGSVEGTGPCHSSGEHEGGVDDHQLRREPGAARATARAAESAPARAEKTE